MYTTENWSNEIKDKEIWDLPYNEDNFSEDNDTSEEEDEGEDDDLEAIKNPIKKVSDELENPKKGFKYFIE